ncbi:MAG: DUF2892 domain-containing protein [Campylobacterota bacterium]|nr:DUF2892 domain-containing protein [Campylobacterota bacterium]
MNKFDKIKLFCSKFRIAFGIILILIGVLFSNPWFYLGVIPIIAGLSKFCPICLITKKCSI